MSKHSEKGCGVLTLCFVKSLCLLWNSIHVYTIKKQPLDRWCYYMRLVRMRYFSISLSKWEVLRKHSMGKTAASFLLMHFLNGNKKTPHCCPLVHELSSFILMYTNNIQSIIKKYEKIKLHNSVQRGDIFEAGQGKDAGRPCSIWVYYCWVRECWLGGLAVRNKHD